MLIPTADRFGHHALMPNASNTYTLAVVDLENLCGGSDLVAARQQFIRSVYDHHGDGSRMTVVASGPSCLQPFCDAWWTWGDARRLVRAGLNGADNALVEVLMDEPLVKRMRCVEVWSGDGAFSEPVGYLRSRGLAVNVFARPGSVSQRLRKASTSCYELPELDELGVLRASAIAA